MQSLIQGICKRTLTVVFWFQNGTICCMKTITLKNIPERLLSQLKDEAKNNHRSLNGEIIFALQLYLLRKKDRPTPEETIRKAREFRAKVKGELSLDEIERSINEGRP